MRPATLSTLLPLFAAGLALSGCCSTGPPPAWASDTPPATETELSVMGEAHGKASLAEARQGARRAAARQAAAQILGKRANSELLERLAESALEIGHSVHQFEQGCDAFEAWVLIRWNRAALAGISAATRGDQASSEVDLGRLRKSAQHLLASGNPVAAAKELRRLCLAAPKDADAHLLLGEAIRQDLARASVGRPQGAALTLRREAERAYAHAANLSPSAEILDRIEQGQVALRIQGGDNWRAKFEALVRRVRLGKRPPEEALLALVKAATPETQGTQRAFLQQRALDVEVHALVTALTEALPAGARVAVLEPEWPNSAYDPSAAVALAKLGRLVSEALVDGEFTVRTPTEIAERLAGASPATHATAYLPAGRAALRKRLEADYAVLLVGGQRVTATAYDLAQGRPLAPIGRVYHPMGEAWSGAPPTQVSRPLRAEVQFLGQKLDRTGGRYIEANLEVTDGVELRLGDQLQCRVKLYQTSYTYLLWCDSVGKVWRVFPETERILPDAPKAARNPLPRGTHLIPGGADRDVFFTLAGTPGRETLYLVVARRPVHHLAALERALETGEVRDPRQTLRKFLSRQAGQSRSLKAVSSNQTSVVLEGPDLIVREITYRLVRR